MAKDPAAPQKKPGRFAQTWQIYTSSKAIDPKIGWWMLLAFVGTLVVVVGIGFLVHAPIIAAILGLPLAILAGVLVMSRRAERAAYRQIEGKPGAAGAALSALRRGWFFDQEPVAVEAGRGADMSSAAMVYRAVGRPGVVLVGEGPSGKAQRVLAAERKRVERVLPNVPVTTLRVGAGKGEDEVAVRKLAARVQRMKPVLTKDEVSAVNKRLRALGGVRIPMPKGMDPTKVRMDRRNLRGR